MVQDYCHINQWTIKNRYLLPLIADILDGVEKRKVFTKLDVRATRVKYSRRFLSLNYAIEWVM